LIDDVGSLWNLLRLLWQLGRYKMRRILEIFLSLCLVTAVTSAWAGGNIQLLAAGQTGRISFQSSPFLA